MKAELLQRGDAICVHVAQRAKRGNPLGDLNNPSAARLRRIGAFFQTAAALGSRTLAQLRALGPPKTDKNGFDTAIAAGQQLAADQATTARAALSGNRYEYGRALANLQGSVPAFQVTTAAFGFKHCGQGR